MMKNVLIMCIIFGIGWCQTTLLGLNGYYSAMSVASSGAIGAVPNGESDQINPAGLSALEPQIQLSIIKYPANIYAQSVNYINASGSTVYGIALRRINYGSFDRIDEHGLTDGSFSANDTWINGSYAYRRNGLGLGVSGGLFFSNIEDYSATALTMAAGFNYELRKIDMQLGFSLSQFGFILSHYTDYKGHLPQRFTLSVNKGLKYLPLELSGDASCFLKDNEISFRFGGIFQLPYNFELIFGINSDNLDQSTEYQNAKSLLGGSGIGLTYAFEKYTIEIGGYSYGSGGWIYGTSFNYKINNK